MNSVHYFTAVHVWQYRIASQIDFIRRILGADYFFIQTDHVIDLVKIALYGASRANHGTMVAVHACPGIPDRLPTDCNCTNRALVRAFPAPATTVG